MHRLLRCAGTRSGRALLLVALLLVPLLASGHHADHTSPGRPCAVCLVAKHSPAVSTSLTAVSGPVLLSLRAAHAPIAQPLHRERPAETGRGPPPPSSLA